VLAVISLPEHLRSRLSAEDGGAITTAIAVIGEELANVYSADVKDHREARGDNAQLFGLKVWVHGRFRLTLRFDEESAVQVLDKNGSYIVAVGGFSIGVYKLGDFADEDIHGCFPDASPTKRGFGERNRAQLTLFDLETTCPLPEDARYGLTELIVGHFGNPRDGLVKWYVGAYVTDELGRHSWAWIARQDLPEETRRGIRDRPPIVPFHAREDEALEIRPRRDALSQPE
jgi:hypothetical protein